MVYLSLGLGIALMFAIAGMYSFYLTSRIRRKGLEKIVEGKDGKLTLKSFFWPEVHSSHYEVCRYIDDNRWSVQKYYLYRSWVTEAETSVTDGNCVEVSTDAILNMLCGGDYSISGFDIEDFHARQEDAEKKRKREAKMKTYLEENPDEVRKIIGCSSKPVTKK
jgi:hypothetical protein